ncbi:MAG: fused response regulator/phosphatase [Thiobacillus sp.]|nr:fused response regulator/phosphatase [Thiobacillus sp.]
MPGDSLKILITDDNPINVKQVEAVVRRLGHVPLVAADGREAIEVFRRECPDLAFMDVMMPNMDGIAAVRALRALPSEKWVPIIFYSALDRMEDIVRGLESGADDYLVKPASLQLLRAKINIYANLLRFQREAREYSRELENWRDDAEEQSRLGAHVMSRLTDAEGLRDPMLQYFNIPAETFSGDLLCAARAPGEVMNVMLADAAGHGLPAALTAMPLTQAFYSMTTKGFPLSTIAEELNEKLKAILPADRFVAATLASVDVRNQTVEVWNGGNPDALYVDRSGEVLNTWVSRHPPLGILPSGLFSGMTETVVFNEPGDLVLCSDGLVEAETPQGEWLGLEGVTRLVGGAESGKARVEHLIRGLKAHLQSESGRDDISCMVLHVPIERRRQIRFAPPSMVSQASVQDWRLDISYASQELRYIDVVPAVLGFVTQITLLKPHQGALFLIVSELFNNALDHGVLGLESGMKAEEGGFERYLQLRMDRLASLREGHVSLAFHLHQEHTQAVLDIFVQDSGPGFDYGTLINQMEGDAAHMDHDRPSGRGIGLVRSLCSQLVYSGTGNKVWARYVLGELALPGPLLEADAA